jgi:hypothetical protein
MPFEKLSAVKLGLTKMLHASYPLSKRPVNGEKRY